MTSGSSALLVPPLRLGRVLHEVRIASEHSLSDLVSDCGLAYDERWFEGIEAGRVPLDESTVRWLADLYDIDVDSLMPQRSQLIVDLEEGSIAIGENSNVLSMSSPEVVLAQYLALVYALRGMKVGAALKLRDLDLDVLSSALALRPRSVQSQLHGLMAGDPEPIAAASRRLRNRLVVPVAGILVGVTAVGALLFVRTDDPGIGARPTATPDGVVPLSLTEPVSASAAEPTVSISGGGAVLVRGSEQMVRS